MTKYTLWDKIKMTVTYPVFVAIAQLESTDKGFIGNMKEIWCNTEYKKEIKDVKEINK